MFNFILKTEEYSYKTLRISYSTREEWYELEARGCSSLGRALALHARGTGIDARHLQSLFFFLILRIDVSYARGIRVEYRIFIFYEPNLLFNRRVLNLKRYQQQNVSNISKPIQGRTENIYHVGLCISIIFIFQ